MGHKISSYHFIIIRESNSSPRISICGSYSKFDFITSGTIVPFGRIFTGPIIRITVSWHLPNTTTYCCIYRRTFIGLNWIYCSFRFYKKRNIFRYYKKTLLYNHYTKKIYCCDSTLGAVSMIFQLIRLIEILSACFVSFNARFG